MTKIDIFSGFLGAGKTTLIKKLIKEAFSGEKLVLIENEFGDVGIDGGFMQDAGIEVTEMNSGCICCSLVGDFGEALKKVLAAYHPDRILIEPSGVGKLSDVIKAVEGVSSDEITLNSFTTVADAKKCRVYMKNFGEFFNNQIENAGTVILSHTKGLDPEKLAQCVALIREHNKTAEIVATDWDELDGKTILETMEKKDTLEAELHRLEEEQVCPHCGGHHDIDHDHDHDHDHDEHEHHHGHDDHDHEHHHEHHHDEHEHEHEHCCDHDHDHDHHDHNHHDHDHCCGHDHDHHHHHADEVFTSLGVETTKTFTKEELKEALSALTDEARFGTVLRAKGIVEGADGWIHFDYVPGEPDIRSGSAGVIGRLCIIGSKLQEEHLKELFHV